MTIARRAAAVAASLGLAALGTLAVTSRVSVAGADRTVEDAVAELVARSEQAHAALMRGDVERYRRLITYTDDFTLMSPFGGKPTRGSDLTAERVAAMGRFFRNGTFEQEVVQTY